jgi:hypothetical protein
MKRSTISLAAVCFVTIVALAGSANAGGGPGRPGGGSVSGIGPHPQQSWKVLALKNSGVLAQQFGHTGKTFNTLPFRYSGGTLKQFGNQFPINGNPEKGHGPVVLPTNPITWGCNPPRAPSHGCDHGWDHDCNKHQCGYSMLSASTCNADSYSSDMVASDTASSDDASPVTDDASQSQDDGSQATDNSTTATDNNTPPASSPPPAPPAP